VIGDLADFYEFLYVEDFFNGEKLSLDEGLASGIGAVLGSGSVYRHLKRWIHAPTSYLAKFESEFLQLSSKAPKKLNYPQSQENFKKSVELAQKIRRSLDYTGTQELSKFLRDNSIVREERSHIIKSFELGSIKRRTVNADEVVYRWHNNNRNAKQMGRYVTQDKIENQSLARSNLALPEKNLMRFHDSFTLKKGSTVFEGRISPYNGQPGGGRQILIPGSLEKSIEFKGRIKQCFPKT
jgi:hypothetical protein